MSYQLRDYQEQVPTKIFDWFETNKTGHPIVDMCVASGKSLVIAELCRRIMQFPNQRILMCVASRELCAQNYEKLKSIYPKGDLGLYSAGLGKKNPHAKIVFATIGSIYNKAMHTGAFNICLIDECFATGTMIKTPSGDKEIQLLKTGDEVISAIGVSKIISTSKKEANNLVEVLLNDGTRIKCTEDHPFFTTSGWVNASKLAGEIVVRNEDMYSLWGNIQAETLCKWSNRKRKGMGKKTVLLSKMLREKCTKSAKNRKSNHEKRCKNPAHEKCERENMGRSNAIFKKNMPFLQSRVSAKNLQKQHRKKNYVGKTEVLQHILCNEIQQSNGHFRSKGKNIKNAEIYWSQTGCNRWERQGANQVTSKNVKSFRFRMEARISNKNICWTQKWSLSKLLQSGYWKRRNEYCNRTGREIAQWKTKRFGCKEGLFSIKSRVESVTHIKREGNTTVFNLHVSGHPSYFANGVLVHNCHNVSRKETGMYRQMIADYTRLNPAFRVIGFTGTPFRGNGILLTEGEEALFTGIAATVSIKDMLDRGYLSPLVLSPTATKTDVTGVHINNATGDYNVSELAKAIDKAEITKSAVAEIIEAGRDRKSWLIFGVNVEHCENIHIELEAQGIKGAVVHGKTPKAQRDRILNNFKSHRIRYVVNCMVLTVGFDHPATDLIALIRNTTSPVLYIQIGGRGMRTAPAKSNCLWLDFTDTTSNLGPIDQIKGRKEPPKKLNVSTGAKTSKSCPLCYAVSEQTTTVCPCGFQFTVDRNINANATSSDAPILSSGHAPDNQLQVTRWQCHKYRKLDAPPTLCVTYYHQAPDANLRIQSQREWVCFEHQGYARRKAENWWQKMGGLLPFPVNVDEALDRFTELKQPDIIIIRKNEKYTEVINHVHTTALPNPVSKKATDFDYRAVFNIA